MHFRALSRHAIVRPLLLTWEARMTHVGRKIGLAEAAQKLGLPYQNCHRLLLTGQDPAQLGALMGRPIVKPITLGALCDTSH